jgi:hypothetical protein
MQGLANLNKNMGSNQMIESGMKDFNLKISCESLLKIKIITLKKQI